MATKNLIKEIHKSLDKAPESVLQDILVYLKQIENHPIEKVTLAKNFRDILIEDKDLLERLAK